MNLQGAIKEKYGVKLPHLSGDGVIKKFKIDQLRNGFVIPFRGCGVFGCVIEAEAYAFDGNSVELMHLEHKENKDIAYEWLIWEMAIVMIDRGEVLNQVDSDRLALAVERLESWL